MIVTGRYSSSGPAGEKRTSVIWAALVGMGKLGYDKASVRKKAKSFQTSGDGETHKAATRYFGYIKDKSAFRMLAEHLDEQRALAPDSPSNPPASYWKERWINWSKNVYYTRWALAQIVPGETF